MRLFVLTRFFGVMFFFSTPSYKANGDVHTLVEFSAKYLCKNLVTWDLP